MFYETVKIYILYFTVGLREIQTRRFEREWNLINVTCCLSETGNILKSTDKIGELLALSDLHNFETKFISEGVSKISHLTDVTSEDLAAIGTYIYIYLSIFCVQFTFKILNIGIIPLT